MSASIHIFDGKFTKFSVIKLKLKLKRCDYFSFEIMHF